MGNQTSEEKSPLVWRSSTVLTKILRWPRSTRTSSSTIAIDSGPNRARSLTAKACRARASARRRASSIRGGWWPERVGVDSVDGVRVFVVDRQYRADLRLAGLHHALALVRLDQRRVRVHGGLQFAAGGGNDILRNLDQVLSVQVAGRVRGWQVLVGPAEAVPTSVSPAAADATDRTDTGRRVGFMSLQMRRCRAYGIVQGNAPKNT